MSAYHSSGPGPASTPLLISAPASLWLRPRYPLPPGLRSRTSPRHRSRLTRSGPRLARRTDCHTGCHTGLGRTQADGEGETEEGGEDEGDSNGQPAGCPGRGRRHVAAREQGALVARHRQLARVVQQAGEPGEVREPQRLRDR